MIYSFNGIVYSNENKSITPIHKDMDDFHESWYWAEETWHTCTCYKSIHIKYNTGKLDVGC